jgi:hypothetical protein
VRYLLPAALLAISCSESTSPPPTPAGPSADMTVSYMAGGQASITSTDLRVTRGPVQFAPGDTTYCASVSVTGSTPPVPLDPSRPEVSQVIVSFCASRFKNFPVVFDALIDGTLVDRGLSSAAGNTVSYDADSGSVHVEPLGGNYAQVDFDAWYRPRGQAHTGPQVFRVAGRLIASE